MIMPVRQLLRACLLSTAAIALLAASGQAPEAEKAKVVDVAVEAPGTIADAIEAFNRGDIIRMIGASESDVVALFGGGSGAFRVFESSQKLDRVAENKGSPLHLLGVAGYKDANGLVRIVQSFGPEKARNSVTGAQWITHLDEWIARERAKTAQSVGGDSEPSSEAWTTLYTATIQATTTPGNFQQDTVAVYRLNTKDQATDHYMVSTIPEVRPNFNSCDGYAHCGWHTYARSFITQSSQATKLTEHGPAGTQSGETVGFEIGASLVGGGGSGVSGAFQTSWYQPDVTTTDNATATTASWDETFHFEGATCNPVLGRVPTESSSTFFSRQGAIFEVPAGTSSSSTSIQASAQFCNYADTKIFNDYDSLNIAADLILGAPQLYAAPNALTISAGQTQPILVSAFIPNSTQGFSWNITSNQTWLSVPGAGPYSTTRPIPVTVSPGTPNGLTGTLSIDSDPPYAAPSVRAGPIQIPITVGTPETKDSAGVLLFGGGAANTVVATPEIYDVNSKQIIPTAAPLFAAQGNSATLLQNGDILIAGGSTVFPNAEESFATNAAQLFHAATRTFTATGSMHDARTSHSAILLPNGKVLIAGGLGSHNAKLRSAEIYDPATGIFTTTGSMEHARFTHVASLVNRPGQPTQVMIYGGGTELSNPDSSTEIWDEATGTFSFAGLMPNFQAGFPPPLAISDGDLAIVGGYGANPNSLDTETLLTPGTQSFRLGSKLNVARTDHTLTALPSSNELITIGGIKYEAGASTQTLGSAEIRDASGWKLVSGENVCPSQGCLTTPRSLHTATSLPDGTVLVAGGFDQNASAIGNTEIFDPATKTFRAGPQVTLRASHTATLFATSTTTLHVGPNPASLGQAVTIAATVTSIGGAAVGTVEFFDGQSRLGNAPLTNGQASSTTATLAAGSHELTAVYSGNGIPASSKSEPVTEVVNQRSTAVSVSSSPNPAIVGENVTFVATVTPTTASGTATFRDGAAVLVTVPLTAGTAKFSTSSLTVGLHDIVVSYTGDNSNAPATAPVFRQTVNQAATTTKLSFFPTKVTYGQPVTLTARVTSREGTPSGSVTFKEAGEILGTAVIDKDLATFQKPFDAGTHTITATYNGSSNYGASSDNATITVDKGTSSVLVTSSANPVAIDTNFTLTAVITSAYGPATGSVTFFDGSNILGLAQLNNGQANLLTYFLFPGKRAITAQYSGDPHYQGSTSPIYQQVVTLTSPSK